MNHMSSCMNEESNQLREHVCNKDVTWHLSFCRFQSVQGGALLESDQNCYQSSPVLHRAECLCVCNTECLRPNVIVSQNMVS